MSAAAPDYFAPVTISDPLLDCAGRGLVDALRDVTRPAAGPLPVPA